MTHSACTVTVTRACCLPLPFWLKLELESGSDLQRACNVVHHGRRMLSMLWRSTVCHQDQVFEDLSTTIVQAGMNVLIMAQYRTKRMSARDSIMSIVDMAWRQGLQGTPENCRKISTAEGEIRGCAENWERCLVTRVMRRKQHTWLP